MDIYLKEIKSLSLRVFCTPMFIAALFTIAKTWKQRKNSSMDEWIKKMYIHIQTMEYYSAIKKKEILPTLNRSSHFLISNTINEFCLF